MENINNCQIRKNLSLLTTNIKSMIARFEAENDCNVVLIKNDIAPDILGGSILIIINGNSIV